MYQIVTDSAIDLGRTQMEALGLEVVPYYITLDGQNYQKEELELPVRDIYKFMVENPKIFPKTSLPTIGDYADVFEKYAKQGIDVLCYTLSAKFSGSFNSAMNAAQMVREDYPDWRIEVIDSTLATLMFGKMIQEACRYRDAGATYDELYKRSLEVLDSCRIYFTIENMNYLVHGGRAGKMLGVSANLLNLRPLVLMADGELHSIGVARGRCQSRKKALELGIDYLQENGLDPDKMAFMTGFGFDEEEGEMWHQMVIQRIRDTWGKDPFIVKGQIGATIGVYTGPHPLGFGFMEKMC